MSILSEEFKCVPAERCGVTLLKYMLCTGEQIPGTYDYCYLKYLYLKTNLFFHIHPIDPEAHGDPEMQFHENQPCYHEDGPL